MKPVIPTPTSLDANGATDGTYAVDAYGTVHNISDEFTTGYIVGIGSLAADAAVPVFPAIFGRWTDEDGTVYWDRVRIIGHRYGVGRALFEAMSLAREGGEIAIWDLSSQSALNVDAYFEMVGDGDIATPTPSN